MINPVSSYLRSTIVLSSVRTLSLGLALSLGMLSAAYFGTSVEKDCFLIAQALPDLVTTLFVGGIYSTLLLGLRKEGAAHGGVGQVAHLKRTIGRIAMVLVPIMLIAGVAPQPLVRILAPGFAPSRI